MSSAPTRPFIPITETVSLLLVAAKNINTAAFRQKKKNRCATRIIQIGARFGGSRHAHAKNIYVTGKRQVMSDGAETADFVFRILRVMLPGHLV